MGVALYPTITDGAEAGIVNEQELADPEQGPPPLQPAKLYPAFGLWFNVTEVP